MTRTVMPSVPIWALLGRVACLAWAASAMSLARPAVHGAAFAQGTDSLHKSTRADSAAPHDTVQAQATPRVSANDSARQQRTAAAPRDTDLLATGADTVLQRVRSLVAQGQTAAARALVDSLLTVTPTTSPSYASVLYTAGTLATNADSAENDYRRVIIEYAASPRVADALLRLAQLELARGDRTQAGAHLDRLVREQLPNQSGATFARTELQVGLAYFDLQDAAHACSALAAARTAAPASNVELRNRIDYNVSRCPPPQTATNNLAQPRDTTRGAHAAGASGSTTAGAASDTMSGHGAKSGTKPGAKAGASKARPNDCSGDGSEEKQCRPGHCALRIQCPGRGLPDTRRCRGPRRPARQARLHRAHLRHRAAIPCARRPFRDGNASRFGPAVPTTQGDVRVRHPRRALTAREKVEGQKVESRRSDARPGRARESRRTESRKETVGR